MQCLQWLVALEGEARVTCSQDDVPQRQDLGRVAGEAVVVVHYSLRNAREVLDVLLPHILEKLSKPAVKAAPLGAF